MKLKKAKFLSENMETIARRDRILLNNPVIMQGMGLAPLVVAATTGRSALILSVAVLLLLTPTRMLAALAARPVPYRFRAIVYCGIAGVLYVAVYLLMRGWFEVEQTLAVGMYLPLLCVEPLIIKRYERPRKEPVLVALQKGLYITGGYILILMLMGCLRELLAAGTLFGRPVSNVHLLPVASLPAGGFILVGVLCAIWRGAVRAYKNYVHREANRTV